MVYYPKERADNGTRIMAGATTGIIGGILMAVFLILYHVFITGLGLWTPFNMAATVAGFSMTTVFGLHTLVGLILHIIYTAVLGLILGLSLVKTPDRTMAMISGLIYALIVFGVVFYVILPLLSPVSAILGQTIPMLTAYALFGLGFIVYPALLERFG